ncbi:hypothetical protein GCM10027168_63340 [Streptomyces capparidis]
MTRTAELTHATTLQPKLIRTIAGSEQGFGGDGQDATKAKLHHPHGIAVDEHRKALYIADTFNHRVRKVSGGIITTIAGSSGECGFSGDGGDAAAARLCYPSGLAVDRTTGDLYIADTGNARLRKVSKGIITTVAGSERRGFGGDGGEATKAELDAPSSVAMDPRTGDLYFADTFTHRVRKVSGGVISTVAGSGDECGYDGDGGDARQARLCRPQGVAVDRRTGDLYLADTGNGRLRKVSKGLITTVAGGGGESGMGKPHGVAVDHRTGDIHLTDTTNRRIWKVSGATIILVAGSGGDCAFDGDGGDARKAKLCFPSGVCVDHGTGSIHIADMFNHRIRKVSYTEFTGRDIRVTFTDTTGHASTELQIKRKPATNFTLASGDGMELSILEGVPYHTIIHSGENTTPAGGSLYFTYDKPRKRVGIDHDATRPPDKDGKKLHWHTTNSPNEFTATWR